MKQMESKHQISAGRWNFRAPIIMIIMAAMLAFNACREASDDDSAGLFLLLSVVGEYTQQNQDNDTSFALLSTLSSLYNSNIAGGSAGPQNVSNAACGASGTANITGTATVSGGVTTVNLDYALTSCRYTITPDADSSLTTDLTLIGTLNRSGEVNGTTTTTGTSIQISGTLTRTSKFSGSPATVSQTCDVSISSGSTAGSVNGTICGRTVSY